MLEPLRPGSAPLPGIPPVYSPPAPRKLPQFPHTRDTRRSASQILPAPIRLIPPGDIAQRRISWLPPRDPSYKLSRVYSNRLAPLVPGSRPISPSICDGWHPDVTGPLRISWQRGRLGYTWVLAEYDRELSEIVAELNRAAPSQKSAERLPQSTASLDELLAFASQRNASDIL